jgi:hypothetical protein
MLQRLHRGQRGQNVGSEKRCFTRGKRGFAHDANDATNIHVCFSSRVMWRANGKTIGNAGIVGNSTHLHIVSVDRTTVTHGTGTLAAPAVAGICKGAGRHR